MTSPDDKDLLKGTWWFPLRKFMPGWGLPVCWQGWVVLAVYLVLLVGPAPFVPRQYSGYYIGYSVALTLVLTVVIAKKGEPLR
jgi:hypothetical protein